MKNLWLWIVAGLAFVFLGKKAQAQGVGAILPGFQTRNQKNNNPGNLRISKDPWVGLRPEQTDPEYFQFVDLYHGWRAMGITLLNYQHRYGLRTISAIVSRWAPPNENNTREYIADVSKRLGLDPAQPFDLRGRLSDLMRAMATHEGGAWPAVDPERARATASALGAVV